MYEHIPATEWGNGKNNLPTKWWDAGKRIIWKDAKLTIKTTMNGLSTSYFDVTLDEGEWPSDEDLVTLCDGDIPPKSRHFGGTVNKGTEKATVSVYTD